MKLKPWKMHSFQFLFFNTGQQNDETSHANQCNQYTSDEKKNIENFRVKTNNAV